MSNLQHSSIGSGEKPLYEPMMVSLLTHACITRPQWVSSIEISIVEIRRSCDHRHNGISDIGKTTSAYQNGSWTKGSTSYGKFRCSKRGCKNYTIHNEWDGVSNHRRHDCLPNRLIRRRSKKTSKLRATGFCEGNSPVSGELPTQPASNAKKVPIWWRHYKIHISRLLDFERSWAPFINSD